MTRVVRQKIPTKRRQHLVSLPKPPTSIPNSYPVPYVSFPVSKPAVDQRLLATFLYLELPFHDFPGPFVHFILTLYDLRRLLYDIYGLF